MMHYYDKHGYSRGEGKILSLLWGVGASIRVNTVRKINTFDNIIIKTEIFTSFSTNKQLHFSINDIS